MADIPFRKILGLNQQTYQRLKLALSLNLRRQIFIAVCDDLTLRDRMATQLLAELNAVPDLQADAASAATEQRYPRLVSLTLSQVDPNPMAQIAQWVQKNPPPRRGKRRLTVPTFQLLGIEQLTRQSPTVQRLFFAHLQSIERSLPALESGLLLWIPRPWFNSLSQSAPAFWSCQTGIFEFMGEPTPSLGTSSEPTPAESAPSHPPAIAAASESAPVEKPAKPDLWTLLEQEIAQSNEVTHPELDDISEPEQPPSAIADLHANEIEKPTEVEPEPVLATQHVVARARKNGAAARTLVLTSVKPSNGTAIATVQTPVKPITEEPQPEDKPKEETAAIPPRPQTVAASSLGVTPSAKQNGTANVPLLRQIEALHQQNAPPAALADAYRTLGNFYRDRIERGDASPQNLQIAIHAYEQVLVWLHEASPLWTDVLNDLGNLYWMQSRNSTASEEALSSIQQSIQAYQMALKKLDLQEQSYAYPMIQNNLGAAYADLARYENPVENLQRSIQAYQQTLRHRKPETEPQKYASTQNNLGTTYWNLAQHEHPVVHLKQSIAAYSEALHHYDPERDPLSYAMIQNNLGTAYWNLSQHERPQDWLRLALSAYQMALRYRTLESTPAAFAATQNNLGTAYWHLAEQTKHDPELKLDYLQRAVNAYKVTLDAIQRLSEQRHPAPLNFDIYATHNNLGLAHYQIATNALFNLDGTQQANHLEVGLHHHIQALEGWQRKADLRQTALNSILQTIRALYNQCGMEGQNIALSRIPGHLLPEILPKL